MHNSLAGVTSILLCNDFLLSWEVKYDSMHWRDDDSHSSSFAEGESEFFSCQKKDFLATASSSNADDTFELLGWILGMAIKILCAGDQPSSTSSILLAFHIFLLLSLILCTKARNPLDKKMIPNWFSAPFIEMVLHKVHFRVRDVGMVDIYSYGLECGNWGSKELG